MCVIIHRQPNITIPFWMIKNACLRNNDGYGIVLHTSDGMVVYKEYNPKGNNPESVYKWLDENKDIPVSLHLRYKTSGAKNEENCHPFQVLNKKDHGRDLIFFHNGTIHSFSGGKEFSDSNLFNSLILKNIVPAFVKAYEDEWNQQEQLQNILKFYAGTGSVFSLVDDNNTNLIINKSLGKNWEGWWSSNNSYFGTEKEFEYPSKYYYGHPTYVTNTSKNTETTKTSTEVAVVPKTSSEVPWITAEERTTSLLQLQANKLKEFLKKFEDPDLVPSDSFVQFKPLMRDKFETLTGISSLEELITLEQEDIETLVTDYPGMASLLIMDLLCELYDTRIVNNPKKVA